jgi:hypothetical protein
MMAAINVRGTYGSVDIAVSSFVEESYRACIFSEIMI